MAVGGGTSAEPIDVSNTDDEDAVAAFEPPASVDKRISVANVGYGMLQKMGWQPGQGLGVANQGRTEPVDRTLKRTLAGMGGTGREGPNKRQKMARLAVAGLYSVYNPSETTLNASTSNPFPSNPNGNPQTQPATTPHSTAAAAVATSQPPPANPPSFVPASSLPNPNAPPHPPAHPPLRAALTSAPSSIFLGPAAIAAARLARPPPPLPPPQQPEKAKYNVSESLGLALKAVLASKPVERRGAEIWYAPGSSAGARGSGTVKAAMGKGSGGGSGKVEVVDLTEDEPPAAVVTASSPKDVAHEKEKGKGIAKQTDLAQGKAKAKEEPIVVPDSDDEPDVDADADGDVVMKDAPAVDRVTKVEMVEGLIGSGDPARDEARASTAEDAPLEVAPAKIVLPPAELHSPTAAPRVPAPPSADLSQLPPEPRARTSSPLPDPPVSVAAQLVRIAQQQSQPPTPPLTPPTASQSEDKDKAVEGPTAPIPAPLQRIFQSHPIAPHLLRALEHPPEIVLKLPKAAAKNREAPSPGPSVSASQRRAEAAQLNYGPGALARLSDATHYAEFVEFIRSPSSSLSPLPSETPSRASVEAVLLDPSAAAVDAAASQRRAEAAQLNYGPGALARLSDATHYAEFVEFIRSPSSSLSPLPSETPSRASVEAVLLDPAAGSVDADAAEPPTLAETSAAPVDPVHDPIPPRAAVPAESKDVEEGELAFSTVAALPAQASGLPLPSETGSKQADVPEPTMATTPAQMSAPSDAQPAQVPKPATPVAEPWPALLKEGFYPSEPTVDDPWASLDNSFTEPAETVSMPSWYKTPTRSTSRVALSTLDRSSKPSTPAPVVAPLRRFSLTAVSPDEDAVSEDASPSRSPTPEPEPAPPSPTLDQRLADRNRFLESRLTHRHALQERLLRTTDPNEKAALTQSLKELAIADELAGSAGRARVPSNPFPGVKTRPWLPPQMVMPAARRGASVAVKAGSLAPEAKVKTKKKRRYVLQAVSELQLPAVKAYLDTLGRIKVFNRVGSGDILVMFKKSPLIMKRASVLMVPSVGAIKYDTFEGEPS